MTEPKTVTNAALDKLPLFATDAELAIVGRQRAEKWRKERLPILAAKTGFPPVDEFHGGRPVPLVRVFYEAYLGSIAKPVNIRARSQERPDLWNAKSRNRTKMQAN